MSRLAVVLVGLAAQAPPTPQTFEAEAGRRHYQLNGLLDNAVAPARTIGANCSAWVTTAPHYNLPTTNYSTELNVNAVFFEPVLVAVSKGKVQCSKSIKIRPDSGTVELYIGTTNPRNSGRFSLELSLRDAVAQRKLGSPSHQFTGEDLVVPLHNAAPYSEEHTVDATDVDSRCRGKIPAQPHLRVELSHPITGLRIMLRTTSSELLLLVRGPSGRTWCALPRVAGDPFLHGNWTTGLYEVWVGHARQETGPALATIPIINTVTFRQRPPPDDERDGPYNPIAPHYARELLTDAIDVLQLAAHQQVLARGRIPATGLTPYCFGYIAPKPTGIVRLKAPGQVILKAVELDKPEPFLVLRTPDGRFLCSSIDTENFEATLQSPKLPSGDYLVWVGTRTTRGRGKVTLEVHSPDDSK